MATTQGESGSHVNRTCGDFNTSGRLLVYAPEGGEWLGDVHFGFNMRDKRAGKEALWRGAYASPCTSEVGRMPITLGGNCRPERLSCMT